MLSSIIILLLIIILLALNKCALSNINIEPQRILLNTTSQTKLTCTKKKDDHHGFEVYLSPNISTNSIQMSTNHLNNTAIEINIRSFNYIGRFSLVCLSQGDNSHLTVSNIIVSKPPGLLFRAEPCVVYYDEYIDCIIRAPIMVQAINAGLDYSFSFVERRLPSQMKVYRPNPQMKKIDNMNKTLTFGWIPLESGRFPSRLKMIIYATIINFGTTNHTMDMTPIFRISSNFTVHILSSTDLHIDFNHKKSSSVAICHGNLTRVDRMHQSNQREDIRTFEEFNLTTIHVIGLRPDTTYRLCFYCHRQEPFRSISDIECQRYKTLKTIKLFPSDYTIIILFCLLSFIIIAFVTIRWNWKRIREKIAQCRKHKECHTDQMIELDIFISGSN